MSIFSLKARNWPCSLVLAVVVLLPMAALASPDDDLIAAVMKKDVAAVAAALAAGAHADAVDKRGIPALKLAAANGDLPIVQALLDAHATVEAQPPITPLFAAAVRGHAEVAKRLLQAGADRNVTDKGGSNLLMAAAASGSAELVDLFLSQGFDVNAKQTEGATAVDFALGHFHWAVVGKLFEKGATLDSSKVGRQEILSFLLARENRMKPDKLMELDEDVPEADVDLFNKAITLGAALDARDKDGNTWLMRAATLQE